MSRTAAMRFSKLLALSLLAAGLSAQTAGSELSGMVVNSSGGPVAHATVTVRNAATGQSATAETDGVGHYTIANLPPGSYDITVTAPGAPSGAAQVRLAPGANQTVNVTLSGAAANPGEPSLSDLGFTPAQTAGNAQEQARLNRRSHMLRTHQRLGLITLAPLVATLVASNGAAGRHSTASGRDLHAVLGGVTAGMYLTTASFAIFAPKIEGTKTRGPIRLHKALAWIHGPGMIMTPVLGAMAFSQRNKGERVHGIAQAHGAVAVVTAAAYGLAMLSVSIKF